jgi:hypothetical protein
MKKSTEDLERVLLSTKPEALGNFLKEEAQELFPDAAPFRSFMDAHIARRQLSRQELFLAAGISPRYGYKLLSGEKRTRQRDVLLRLFLAAHMELQEVQRGLKLYGMSPLYVRIPRDALLMSAWNRELYSVSEVNALLCQNGQMPLEALGTGET